MVDVGYRLLAARYIRRQAKQLAEQLDGVRAAEDIEFVHRARVATRRLRAALRDVRRLLRAKQVKRWQKAIRRTTTKLGDARDRDVQIEFLCGILSVLNAKECFPGIARILVQLERDRERLQRKVVKAVDRLEAQGRLAGNAAGDQADSAATPRRSRRTCRPPARLRPDPTAHPSAVGRICSGTRRAWPIRTTARATTPCGLPPSGCGTLWRSPGPCIRGGSTSRSKRSRGCNRCWATFTTATFGPSISTRSPRTSATASSALFGHAGRFVRLQPGIEYLQADRRGHRQEVFGQLVAYWAELDRRQFWDGSEGGRSQAPRGSRRGARPRRRNRQWSPRGRDLAARDAASAATGTAMQPSGARQTALDRRLLMETIAAMEPNPIQAGRRGAGQDRRRHRRGGQRPADGHRRGLCRRPDRGAGAASAGGPPGARHLPPRPAGRREHEGRRRRCSAITANCSISTRSRRSAPWPPRAVREAANGDTFLDRVFMATRLNVEVIDTSEESRLTVSAVRQAVGDALGVNQRQTLIADVGGGSTLLTLLGGRRDRHLAKPAAGFDPAAGDVLHQRGIAAAVGRPAAAAHRQRAFHAAELVPLRGDRLVRGRRRRCPLRRPRNRHAHRIGRPGGDRSGRASTSWWTAASGTRPRSCRSATACRSPRPKRSIRPCWSTRSCCSKTKAQQMIVSHVSMRDGLLLELAREVTGKEDEAAAAWA